MTNDINKEDPHYKGEYGSIYEVNRKFPTGGVAGDFVVIEGWAHYWNAVRGTWCVNAERDSYWDELITNIIEKFKLVRGATYMGVASLDTVPTKVIGSKMYYFSTIAGTYKNFGGLVVPQGINVLYSDNGSSWVNTTLLEVTQELGVSTNKVMSQKAVSDKLSDLSINTPFDNISLYKSEFIELKKEKYAYIRSIVKDIYVVLSDGDTNRYQITQLQIVNDKKIISIYTETDNGKFNNLALTVYDTDGNFIKKILRNKTIIYLYIDWEKLTNKNVVISEIGAFSNDISYIEHFGPIYDRLLLEQQNMLATNQNILAESFFHFNDNISSTYKSICYTLIKDILVSKNDNVDNCKLVYISYDKTIDSQKYTGVNFGVTLKNGDYKEFSMPTKIGGKGIELLEYHDKDFNVKVVLNWNLFIDKTELLYHYFDCYTIDTYYHKHVGLIQYIEQQEKSDTSYKIYDQMYIHNGKVICNNNGRNNSNIIAKYAQVDMKSNIVSAKLRFIAANSFVNTLAVTKLKTAGNIGNITQGSLHICFKADSVQYGLFISGSWKTSVIQYTKLNIGTEYTVGFNLLGENKLELLLPDGTTQINIIENLDSYIGNRFIFEHYFKNTQDEIVNNMDGYCPYTGIYCRGVEKSDILKDNFRRADGSLGVAPTGQVYTLFSNAARDRDLNFDN